MPLSQNSPSVTQWEVQLHQETEELRNHPILSRSFFFTGPEGCCPTQVALSEEEAMIPLATQTEA